MATTAEVRRCTRIRNAPLMTGLVSYQALANQEVTRLWKEHVKGLDINVRKRPDSLRLRCHAWSDSEEDHAGFGQ